MTALAAVVSLGIWGVLAISIVGALYAAMLGLFFFVAHLALIGHVRGNGVRLGPDQLPELHEMVTRLSARIGLASPPEAYLMQGGGTLNAFATRFLSADIVVLYSDLVDACGEDRAACEMIVGHELAHVQRGHLRWHWFLLPAFLVPFLGTALSRAREFTCDRFGLALAGEGDGALLGLTILAAGGRYGRQVNRPALVAQQAAMNTGLMRLAEWLSTHPPLAVRLEKLDPALAAHGVDGRRGTLRAWAILGALTLPFVLAGLAAALLVPTLLRQASQQQSAGASRESETGSDYEPPPLEIATAQVDEDFARLSAFLRAELAAGRTMPTDSRDLYKRWNVVRRYDFEPYDPFDGERYGYDADERTYVIWSSGPDRRPDTDDDFCFDSRVGTRSVGRRTPIRTTRATNGAPSVSE